MFNVDNRLNRKKKSSPLSLTVVSEKRNKWFFFSLLIYIRLLVQRSSYFSFIFHFLRWPIARDFIMMMLVSIRQWKQKLFTHRWLKYKAILFNSKTDIDMYIIIISNVREKKKKPTLHSFCTLRITCRWKFLCSLSCSAWWDRSRSSNRRNTNK
jgi:hypothetical protein